MNLPAIKLIIAGSREFDDYPRVEYETRYFLNDYANNQISIISGTARGADRLGIRLAQEYGLGLIEMPAEWDIYGRSAGYIRNEKMAQIATHALIFWNQKSRGSRHMIEMAKKYKLDLKVVHFK